MTWPVRSERKHQTLANVLVPTQIVEPFWIPSGRQMLGEKGVGLTVDPAAVLGRQESDDAGDVLGHGAALQRAVLGHEVLDLLGRPLGGTAGDLGFTLSAPSFISKGERSSLFPASFFALSGVLSEARGGWSKFEIGKTYVVPCVLGEHVGLDTTRGNAVDGDPAHTKVRRERLNHTDDGHLGGVVQHMVPHAQQTRGDGAHQDQAAVVLQVLPGGLADEELRARVQVEDVVELLLGDLLRLVPGFRAGVAHDDVDLAERLLGVLEQPLDLGFLRYVGLDGDGLRARPGRFNLLAYFVGGGLAVGVVHDHAAAALAQLDGAATADTTAGAGDEGDLAVEGGGGDGDGLLRHDGC